MTPRNESPASSERTPLLPRDNESEQLSEEPKKKSRLPSFIALGILCLAVIFAIIFGFATPAIVEEYAKEALTFNPSTIAIDSITDTGVRVKVQGTFYLDASKVHRKAVRDLGRAATWIAKEVESGETVVQVYLPEYGEALLGTVHVPPQKFVIRNGHDNSIDTVADIEPGDVRGLRSLAHDVLDGKQSLDVRAVAKVAVKSGLISLGTQKVTQSMTFHRGNKMKMPKVDIANLQVSQNGHLGTADSIIAKAEVSALNPYPVGLEIPPLTFEIMLPDCGNKPLVLGSMQIGHVNVLPKQIVSANVTGFMRQLPSELTQACPGTEKSPLDAFIGSYLKGETAKIFVKGGEQNSGDTPAWVGNILKEITLPIPVPSHPFGNMIKNYSMSDVHFSLPDFVTTFDPLISADVDVAVGLPKGIDVEVSVDRIRADAEVFYEGNKLGDMNLREWQKASSVKVGDELHVQSEIRDAPLRITNQEVFTKILQTMIFDRTGVNLEVHADVDIYTATVLGEFEVRRVPAKNVIYVDPPGGDRKMEHTVKDIAVASSSPEELVLQATVDVRNPTDYFAHIPFVNISVWCNDTQLGYAWGSFDVSPGMNTIVVQSSLAKGPVSAELLSQYISGYNVSLTLASHEGGIPGIPDPQLAIDVPLPHMFGKFMKETTMHVWSSTVTFVLFSPLPMTITSISAQASYQDQDVGTIVYGDPIEISPGNNETPNLPVEWSLSGGWDLIKHAIGGDLKLDAIANTTIQIGEWSEDVWFKAHGIGANITWFMIQEDEM